MTVHYRPNVAAIEIGAALPARLRFTPKSGLYRDRLKRTLDLIIVALLALPALVLMAVFLPLIALDGASPIYRQARVGRGGREFRLWKVRSMVTDADARLAAYLADNPAALAEWNLHQKLRHDPRITRIGRFIRKTSIDELPQLLNVLAGEMSMVGPRPMMVNQQDIYPGHAYYEMLPGITGAWQVSDRHETSFSERALFDTRYYNSLTLGQDLSIIGRTVGVVLRAAGV